jgi:CheY-like chemotaxis protein
MKKNYRYLIVDDEPDVIRIVRFFLEDSGCKPDQLYDAYSAQECVEKIEEVKPDMVILDVMMPGKDGLWACAVIKSRPEFEKVKVVLYTALPEDEIRLKAKLCGADGFMQKGIGYTEFIDYLDSFRQVD